MSNEKLTLYYITKYTNYELLIDGLILTNQLGSWEKNKRRNRAMKLKLIRVKIFYAIIFGILPIFPLLGYFQIADILLNSLIDVDIIIFHGCIYFGLFFVLQFFNFFLMGMLETGMIMSGRIFEWLETLPIEKKKLKKIVLITIFRSFDIPIIVIIIIFPLITLIGTQSIIIFIISIFVSILNVFFSFNILLLIGGRIRRVLDVNEINSKRSYTIRLFNILSYIIITLGSMYLIQWAFSSIDRFFIQFMNLPNPEMTNLILSSIPYPFNPSYIILNFVVSDRTPLKLWITSIIGLVIFVLITWWLYTRALKQLEKLTFSKFRHIKEKYVSKRTRKELGVKIESLSPVKAYLRKDIILISHDLKTLLTIITSVILSFIFLFYYNTGIIGEDVHVVNVIYTNWIGLIIFHPILSGMLIHSILSLEDSGQSVLTSLPIIPREQAKTKLYIIFIVQTIAAFLPNLMFLNDSNSMGLLLATLAGFPFISLFLMMLFELKINFFGKIGKRYVIKEVNPDNKLFKWVLIISLQYIIIFWMTSFVLTFSLYNNFTAMVWFISLAGVIGLIIVRIIYIVMFPSRSKLRRMAYFKEKKVSKEEEFKSTVIQHPTILLWHPWVSIFLLLFLDFCFLLLDMNLLREESPYFDPSIIFYLMDILHIIFYNLTFASFLIILVPFVLGLPYGRQSIKEYLNKIGLDWIKLASKGLIFVSIIAIFMVILLMLLPPAVSILFFNPNITYYGNLTFISFLSYIFWQEVLFRGVILRILLNKYSKQKAIILNSIIFWLWFSFFQRESIIISIPFLFLGFVLSYLSLKTKSLLPAIIVNILLSSIYFPLLL